MDSSEQSQGFTRSLLQGYCDDDININNNNNINGVHHHHHQTSFPLLFSTFIAVCGSYAFGNAIGYSSPAETGIVDDLGLTLAQYSVFGSILTIGGMVGAVFSGRIADLVGRKGAMWVSELLCIIGWLAIAFAESAWVLDVGRLLVGCALGVISYVVPVYVTEITPKNVRGGLTSLNQLLIGCGKALTFLIGSFVNWRTLALLGTIPCIIQVVGLFFIPESPRWLLKRNRVNEFESALQRLRGNYADISEEAADIKDYTDNLKQVSNDGIFNLFKWKYAHSLTIGIGLMLFQELGGLNGYAFYTSYIFESAGFPSNPGIVAAAVVQILGCCLGVFLIDKLGRRPLLLVSAGGTCLGCVITALTFLLKDVQLWTEITPILVLIGVLVFLSSFEIALGGIPWIIMSEIYPVNIKGSAGTIVNLTSWVGSWLVAYTFIFLFEWSSPATFFIYAVVCGLGLVFIAKLVPETKGRTLEEIQQSLTIPT